MLTSKITCARLNQLVETSYLRRTVTYFAISHLRLIENLTFLKACLILIRITS
jgi:hypothetical protein